MSVVCHPVVLPTKKTHFYVKIDAMQKKVGSKKAEVA